MLAGALWCAHAAVISQSLQQLLTSLLIAAVVQAARGVALKFMLLGVRVSQPLHSHNMHSCSNMLAYVLNSQAHACEHHCGDGTFSATHAEP